MHIPSEKWRIHDSPPGKAHTGQKDTEVPNSEPSGDLSPYHASLSIRVRCVIDFRQPLAPVIDLRLVVPSCPERSGIRIDRTDRT